MGYIGCFFSSQELMLMRGSSEGFFLVLKSKLVSQELYGEEKKCTNDFGGET
jgi:hypothetical protein